MIAKGVPNNLYHDKLFQKWWLIENNILTT